MPPRGRPPPSSVPENTSPHKAFSRAGCSSQRVDRRSNSFATLGGVHGGLAVLGSPLAGQHGYVDESRTLAGRGAQQRMEEHEVAHAGASIVARTRAHAGIRHGLDSAVDVDRRRERERGALHERTVGAINAIVVGDATTPEVEREALDRDRGSLAALAQHEDEVGPVLVHQLEHARPRAGPRDREHAGGQIDTRGRVLRQRVHDPHRRIVVAAAEGFEARHEYSGRFHDASLAAAAVNDGRVSFPLEDWKAYAASGPADDLLAAPLRPTVADLALLRKDWPQGVVAVAVEHARARNRAASKFASDLVARLVADEEGVMVASSTLAAVHKAARFARVGDSAFDLCCGIGADAFELVRTGVGVTAIDLDPTRAWMAGHNARCEARVADVGSEEVIADATGTVVHLDPSRRMGSKRRHDYASYQPGPGVVEAIVERAAGACIKLGPGVDFSMLPRHEQSHLEFVSEHGRLTQALLWTGTLAKAAGVATGQRLATLLPSGEAFAAAPGPLIDADEWYDSDGPATPVLGYVFEPDASLERSGLLGSFARSVGLRPIHPAVGVLTGASEANSPWLTGYQVIEAMPWRTKAVRSRLLELGAGIVTIKTRAKLVDPDALQKTLRGKGDRALVVFILRLGEKATAIICERSG